MSAEPLTTKLNIPPLRANLVPRPHLIRQMNEGLQFRRRLTLVSAPAGFGKTTLASAWLKQSDHPAAWLSLDETDNELMNFLTHLATALQTVDEQAGTGLLGALQSPQLPAIEKILTALLNEIAIRVDPLILVLDDYHLLTETAIAEMMEFILLHQPPQLHLALITREDPPLPLARLRARDQLTEIRARDLRFTPEETEAFLRDVMGLELSRRDVEALEDRTEGWAAGLQLAGLSIQKQANPTAFIAAFSGSHRHILDYLTEEVLQGQPESIRAFLLHTAVLDRLSGPLCEALTGRKDSHRLLAQLEAGNLFVIPLDEERRWYRYHHLFADLLHNQLTRSHPELVPELHLRASRWYEENGDIQTAVEHALRASDLTHAAGLIERHAIPTLYQGQVTLVIGWYERLPGEILESAPMLCIGKAWALAVMQRGMRRETVELALETAKRALERGTGGDALAEKKLRDLVAGHIASIRAFLLQLTAQTGDKPEELIALSQEALRLLPVEDKGIRSVNALNIGYGYLALADLEAAKSAFTQTLEEGVAGGNYYAAIYGPINLALSAVLLGQLREALQLCEANIERFNRLMAGQHFPPIGALYILKGSILLEFDRPVEAEQTLAEGLDLIQLTGEIEGHLFGYTAMARLRAVLGDKAGMRKAVETLEEAWPEGAVYAQALRHRLTLRHWPDDPEARQEAEAWLARSGLEFDELPAIESLDAISEAHFESYLNAAHVLGFLAKEQPGAYPGRAVQPAIGSALAYLDRQAAFAETRGLASWITTVNIARTALYQAAGEKGKALAALGAALRAAAHTGLFRIFVDECESLQALLEEARPGLAAGALQAYAGRVLESMRCEPAQPEIREKHRDALSERELEVLRYLAQGLSYQEIGQELFLSLNTIQFHVKNIYSKLLVNKRVHAIEKARELNLI